MTVEVSPSLTVDSILVAAHDLKAPLCLARQLALSLGISKNPVDDQRIKSQLVSVSERALRQVDDLTKIARLEDGLFAMGPVSVRGVCDAVYRELDPLFRYEQRRLRLTYANRSRLAIANRELLHRVIYNFCTNALHYSTLETESELSVVIRIGVRDFGPALPTHVWRELKSGGLTRPTRIAMRPGSSGLGLYIASEFARYMHAELGAIRHRDGTSFFVDLPVSQQASLFGV
jgi:signal transduction histidine kinase